MKKFSIILLILLVSLFLIVSCGEDKGNDVDTNQTNASEQTGNPAQSNDSAQAGDSDQTNPPETEIIVPADKVETFRINGADISEFKIFALDGIEEGQTLADDINEKYLNVTLPVESGTIFPGGEKYIILDRQSYAYHDYSMTLEGGNLRIKGSFRSFQKALEVFVGYLDGNRGADVNITDKNNFAGKIDKVTPLYSTKEELLAIYQYASDSNYTLYGEHWGGPYTLSTLEAAIRERVGDGPAILDIDMVGFYIGSFSRSMISQAVCEALEFSAKGGIITTFCHWQNPNEEGRMINGTDSIHRGSIGSKELWNSLFVEGSEYNKKWKAQLDFNAEVYQAFKDLGLPVTFRPMHEANTGNFWFSYYHDGCMLNGDDLRNMWNYVYDYYVYDLGLDNMLWTYSPNAITGGGQASIDFYYPGDDKCDLVGMDWYIDSTMSRYLANGYGFQDVLSYGKPAGLCEWGIFGNLSDTYTAGGTAKSFSCRELVDIIQLAKSAGLKLSFLETYSTYFGSAAWLPEATVLNETLGIILLDDMPDIIRNALG